MSLGRALAVASERLGNARGECKLALQSVRPKDVALVPWKSLFGGSLSRGFHVIFDRDIAFFSQLVATCNLVACCRSCGEVLVAMP